LVKTDIFVLDEMPKEWTLTEWRPKTSGGNGSHNPFCKVS
jgi:hypothetical protein